MSLSVNSEVPWTLVLITSKNTFGSLSGFPRKIDDCFCWLGSLFYTELPKPACGCLSLCEPTHTHTVRRQRQQRPSCGAEALWRPGSRCRCERGSGAVFLRDSWFVTTLWFPGRVAVRPCLVSHGNLQVTGICLPLRDYILPVQHALSLVTEDRPSHTVLFAGGRCHTAADAPLSGPVGLAPVAESVCALSHPTQEVAAGPPLPVLGRKRLDLGPQSPWASMWPLPCQ